MDLSNEIPLAEAAAFFVRLKGAAALPGDERFVPHAWKTAGVAPPAPPPLPPAAMGQNPTASATPPPPPQAALGQHKVGRAARLFKRALDEAGLGSPAASDGDGAPPMADYVARERAARGAEDGNVAAFYQQKMQQALAELATQQERAQATEEQLATLDQQVQQGEMLRQQYQQMVSSATQQTVAAQDQVLREQQGSAALRMAYQQLRGQLLNVATQEPPTTQSLQDQAAIAASQSAVPVPGSPPQGPAGEAVSAGTAPGTPAPAGAEALPAPSGASGGKSATTPSASEKGIKEAGAIDAIRSRLPHAALGAGLGALSELAYAGKNNDPLRAKVQHLEGQDQSLGTALDLAQAKARLALGELVERHPTAALLSGAAAGAFAGIKHGPAIAGDVRAGVDNLRRLKALA